MSSVQKLASDKVIHLVPSCLIFFMNDLVDAYDRDCDGAAQGEFEINCLMHVDDVILIY